MTLYDYGARCYNPGASIFLNVDPLAEQTMEPYSYVGNNPINFTDPTGMSKEGGESIGVRKIGEGKYEVVSGKADGDKSIYLADSKGHYNKKSEKIGESLTEYSFLTEEGKAVKGAVINTYDTSGIDFLNNEVVNNSSLTQLDYMPNATGGKHYDFKARGRNELPTTQWNKHHYRGMLFQGIDNMSESNSGKTIFASARDIGNVGAGYFAASKGWNWSDTRSAFDGLQKWQQLNPFATEGKPSQYAQKVGHTAGYRIWGQKNPMQYRNRQRNGLN
ncbi:RHS repeat-associated core domain-containing protein [Flavobacterium sp. NKUCC04_CG]|uniref:RHS repeat-associated core domain-containing protein n=1 Tax=Flavobacterium sp. NKUCC04_CG TaxID=2842121 RepID=UPI001C5B38D7|nr:RHS repeat-associated core domain-containing protein [Flavobacterium sp. NKUCC04_CG]MBW3520482.1 hypothetical protein [Flavobacterium sp. NKUCC04_CG]